MPSFSKYKDPTAQFLKPNTKTNHTYDLIGMVKACKEPTTLFGRTKYRGLVQTVCHKVPKRSSLAFEFRVVFLLGWLPIKAKEPSLSYYLTRS